MLNPAGPGDVSPGQIAEAVYGPVRRFCWKHAPPAIAEDLAQSVMVVMLKRAGAADPFRPEFGPLAYALGVAKSMLRNAREQFVLRRTHAFTDLTGEDDRPFEPTSREAEETPSASPDQVARVRAVLAAMPAADLDLLRLRHVAWASVTEIAAKLIVTTVPAADRAALAAKRLLREAVT